MHPELVILGTQVHAWGLFLVIGFAVGMAVGSTRLALAGVRPTEMIHVGALCFVFGVAGCALWGAVEYGTGEMVSWGGLILAPMATVAFLRLRRHPVRATGDALIVIVPLGEAFGRLGCFLNGCCYGRPCGPAVPWGLRVAGPIVLPSGEHAMPLALEQFRPAGLALADPTFPAWLAGTPFPLVHPAQLYASAGAFALFLALDALLVRKRYHGEVLLAAVCGYGALRLVVEGFRGDVAPVAWGLGTGQLAALAFVASTLPFLVRGRLAGAPPS